MGTLSFRTYDTDRGTFPQDMMEIEEIHPILFLTRAVSLSRWAQIGILEREVALYRELRRRLRGISVVTSGGKEELAYQDSLGDARILYNRWGLGPNVYSLLAPFLHKRALQSGTVYKTNQLDGAWTAISAGRMYRKPVVVRAGYLWAEFFGAEGGDRLKAAIMHRLQAFSFKNASLVVLTTEAMKRQVVKAYGLEPEKVCIVPNYVDTDRFRPRPEVESVSGRVCYVGRLHPRKNLGALIQAVARVPRASLVLIGQGEQQPELEALAARCQANVQFRGALQHEQVALEISRSDVFALPSLFEGHPKALIEAMACGVSVVGADVEGIRNVIRQQETGLLCPPTAEGIASALEQLLTDAQLRERLGTEARAFVKREYSLKRVVGMELAILRRMREGRSAKSPT